MSNEPNSFEHALGTVVADFGTAITNEPARLRAALTDVLGEAALAARADIDAVVLAAERGIAVRAAGASPDELAALEAELVALGSIPSAASVAVSAWQVVLGASVADTATPSTPGTADDDEASTSGVEAAAITPIAGTPTIPPEVVEPTVVSDDALTALPTDDTTALPDDRAGAVGAVAPVSLEAPSTPADPPRPARRRVALLAAVVALLVLVSGISAFALVGGSGGGDDKVATGATTTSNGDAGASSSTSRPKGTTTSTAATATTATTVTTVPGSGGATKKCPNGVTYPAGAKCPDRDDPKPPTHTCWDGKQYLLSQPCPPQPTTTLPPKPCPNGSSVPANQECPKRQCWNGQWVEVGLECPPQPVPKPVVNWTQAPSCIPGPPPGQTSYATFKIAQQHASSWRWYLNNSVFAQFDNTASATWGITYGQAGQSFTVKVVATNASGATTVQASFTVVEPVC
jgi:hypothetical protein